jgi:hypothetical protein
LSAAAFTTARRGSISSRDTSRPLTSSMRRSSSMRATTSPILRGRWPSRASRRHANRSRCEICGGARD